MENAIMSKSGRQSPVPSAESFPSSTATTSELSRYRSLMMWTGRVLSGLYVLFMLGASVTPKLLQMPVVDTTMTEMGWPAGSGFWIGILELSCVVLYLIPRTSVFGAVLMMGVLGGAITTHIPAHHPLFSHVLFPVYVGLFMWGGLWLRSPQLRDLFPLIRDLNSEK